MRVALAALLLPACWRGGETSEVEPESVRLAVRGPKLVGLLPVPEGAITEGCLIHRGARCLGREMPAFEILGGYVTKDDWARCVAAGACPSLRRSGAGDRPITGVAFAEAKKFCRWAGMHLSTESEWERARSAEVIHPGEAHAEWLDGWYTYFGPGLDAPDAVGPGQANARLLIRIFDGNSYRYGVLADRREADLPIAFRCSRGETPTDPPPTP
ncbi:MAG: SUMF1/EgtB/PvdO family nonheme iron enzyme [Kofleriaceae bacterium]|nr:SUMF1/EgtB/PvdO family nonheme iron enzyme [Kofleriaceae bacterium]